MTKKTANSVKKEVIKSMIELAEKEIIKNQIIADFYRLQATGQEAEEASKTNAKAGQVQQTVEFNIKFNDYLKSL